MKEPNKKITIEVEFAHYTDLEAVINRILRKAKEGVQYHNDINARKVRFAFFQKYMKTEQPVREEVQGNKVVHFFKFNKKSTTWK